MHSNSFIRVKFEVKKNFFEFKLEFGKIPSFFEFEFAALIMAIVRSKMQSKANKQKLTKVETAKFLGS